MDNWRDVQLGDFIDIKHGYAFPGEHFSSDKSEDILMTPGNFALGGGFQWGKRKYYHGPVPNGFILSPGDIIVTMTDLSKASDTLGYAAITPKHSKRLLHNQRVGKVLFKSDAVDSDYIHWTMRSPAYRNEILSSATGSTVKHTSPNRILSFRFYLPPKHEQKQIASILRAFEDKIDLNRRMNETLEAMAKTIFTDWFVDFGPTRAKMENRPSYLASDLWGLFPEQLDDQEKPEGWEVTALWTVLSALETGGRPKGGVSTYTSGVPSIGAESIVGLGIFDFNKTKFIPKDFFEKMERGVFKNRDVLLYKDGGRPGEYEPHVSLFGDSFPFKKFAINEHVYRIRALPELGQSFLYFWLSSDAAMSEMRKKGTGVAIPGLNSTQVKSLTALKPSWPVTKAFDFLVNPLVTHILANSNENRSLGITRNLLLAKLISGEVRVHEAERVVEAVL